MDEQFKRGSVRNMPSRRRIAGYWAERLVELGKFDSVEEVLEADYCFACGFDWPLERAHITAKCLGGIDEVSNLHNLCVLCHQASEPLSGEGYWQWFVKRNIWERMIHGALFYRLATIAELEAATNQGSVNELWRVCRPDAQEFLAKAGIRTRKGHIA